MDNLLSRSNTLDFSPKNPYSNTYINFAFLIFNFSFFLRMASRTNKRGIAAKKAQLQKQASRTKGAKRFSYPKRKLDIDEAKEFGVIGVVKNPKGNEYHRFLRGRKTCRETGLRTDPDGYRLIRTPSGSTEVVQAPISGRTRGKLIKKTRTKN